MRRASTILIGIALGAIASGIGVGIFLKLANDDRKRLAEQLQETAKQAQEAREQNQQAIEEANKKLLAANSEVGKAQNLVKTLEEERVLLASAKPLTPPSPKTIRDWKDIISLDMGVSLKYPSGSIVEMNTAQGIAIAKSPATDGDARWFSFIPYNDRLEMEIRASFTTSTPISYVIGDRLITGWRGVVFGKKDPVVVLHIRSSGQLSYLIWARENAGMASTIASMLATIHFES